jgi:hypothetical protein
VLGQQVNKGVPHRRVGMAASGQQVNKGVPHRLVGMAASGRLVGMAASGQPVDTGVPGQQVDKAARTNPGWMLGFSFRRCSRGSAWPRCCHCGPSS